MLSNNENNLKSIHISYSKNNLKAKNCFYAISNCQSSLKKKDHEKLSFESISI